MLIGEMKNGYDVVIGVQKEKQDALIKKMGSRFMSFLNTRIFDKPKHIRLSSFRIMTDVVAREIAVTKTPSPFFSGIMLSLTHNNWECLSSGTKKESMGNPPIREQKLICFNISKFDQYGELFGRSGISVVDFCL